MKGYFGIIEAALTLAIVFGWGFWQLRSLTKTQTGDKAEKDPVPPRESRESEAPLPEQD